MKLLMSLLMLTAMAAVSYSAIAKAPAARANLAVGNILAGDRLLHRAYLYTQPSANRTQYEDVEYRGNSTIRIRAVQALEIGGSQYAMAWITEGGIGYNNVTVRVQSIVGYGYNYIIDIWGP